MKKIVFAIVVIFLSLSLNLFSQFPPPCEPGYTAGSIDFFNLPMDNGEICDMTLYYCWKDDITGDRTSCPGEYTWGPTYESFGNPCYTLECPL